MMRSIDIEAIAADRKGKERDYWLGKLAGDVIKTGFPPDMQVAASADSQRQSDTFVFKLPAAISTKAIQISKNSDPRLFVVLLTGFVALLKKYTGHHDITVGAPVVKQEVDAKFINTVLVLRNILENDMTFKDLLLTVRQTASEAAENQNYPLNILMDELNIPHSGTEFPLFNTAILLENIHDKSYIAHIPLDMYIQFNRVNRTGEEISGCVEYNNTMYRSQTIEQIVSHFSNLLQVALFNPDIRLSGIDIQSEEEKNRLVYDFNKITTEYPSQKSIQQLFEEQVEAGPDVLAIIYKNEQLTYSGLNENANRMAILLKSKGVKPGKLVAMLIDRSLEMMVAIMAVLKAGGAYMPISLKCPPERVKYVIEDSRAEVLLTRQQFLNAQGNLCNLESIDVGNIGNIGRGNTGNLNNSNDAVYVIYTSGSTGKPKGVIMEHRCVANLVAGLHDTIYKNYGKPLRVCVVAPYEFDASAQQIFGALLQGHSLYVVPDEARLDGAELANFYEKYKINISDGTPSHIRLLLEGTKGKTLDSNIKHFIIAGEAFPRKLAEEFFKRFKHSCPNVSNIYGPTETCVDSTFYHISPGNLPPYDILPIGNPLPNQQVYILDNENQLLPMGVPGELCIGGDGVGRGYLNQPELTAEKFKKYRSYRSNRTYISFYKTGDLARWLPGGTLEFLGRIDNQVKLRGNRIELGEIENQLRNFEAVKDAIVVIRKEAQNAEGDEQLVAYVTPDPMTASTVKRLLQLEKEGLRPGQQFHCLPNGMPAFYINLHEAENLYREIFEEYSYWKYGIELQDGACIFDIGANIGMFTLFVHNRCKDAQIYSIEPLPPTCEVLRLNTRLHEVNANVYNIGISDRDGVENFTYFPNSPAMSGRFANLDEEIETARTFMINREIDGNKGVGLSQEQVDEIVEERLNTESYSCTVKSLSSLIRENQVDKIDLLKIDVEKGEIDVLNGIAEEDWGKIQQLVIEIHNVDDRLEGIIRQLEAHGFHVAYEQDTLYKNTKLYNLYAIRGEIKKEAHGNAIVQWKFSTPGQLIVDLKNHLNRRLPDIMIPSSFILLDSFPLTPNGKIDRSALPAKASRHFDTGYEAPRDEIEKKLTDIWSAILGVEKDAIGIDSDFFDLGGHSLKATLLVSRMHKELNVKLPLAEVFKNPTIKTLAEYLRGLSINEFVSIDPVEKKEFYPLSSTQKRLYVIQCMDKESTAYNMPGVFVLEGNLDLQRLENAFIKLIARHESLRTSFELIGEPVQRIYEPGTVPFKIDNYRQDAEAVPSTDATPAAIKKFTRAFVLAVPPLLRVGLIQLAKEKNILLVDMHHIITDGASQGIFVNDLLALYLGKKLPPLTLQYKDFSSWQNEQFETGAFKKQEDYWLGSFLGDIPVLEMPTDYQRALVQQFEGGDIRKSIDREISQGIRRLATQTNATVYMVLLAVYYVLLAKYTGQEDIVVGTPVIGRRHADLENIIGMFVNTLALRNYPKSEKTFRNFLQEVIDNSIKAFENQDYPLDGLVEKLKIERIPGRNPLFDVMFSYSEKNKMSNDNIESTGLKFGLYELDSRKAKFDLNMETSEEDDQLILFMVYCSELYKKETIERIITDFNSILETIVNDIDIKIADIELESVKGLSPQYEDAEEISFNI